MRHLDLTEIARADLKSIRRYSSRAWGADRTVQDMAALRATMKRLVAGTVVSRNRDDLRSGLQMATSGVIAYSSKRTNRVFLSFACSTTE